MKHRRIYLQYLFLALLPLVSVLAQRIIGVKTADELRSALKQVDPGTILELADGDYDFNGRIEISLKATRAQPIIVRAKNRGKSRIINNSRIVLTEAEHIVIEGLNFESSYGSAIKLCGCQYVQITRNTFHLQEVQHGSWLTIEGIDGDSVRLSHHNRIDHNIFEKKSLLGNFITIVGTIRAQPQISQYDRIDHNLFADIGPRVENGMEALRIGSSVFWASSGYTVVEGNLFERCDGDQEYITVKSCDDTIRNNTFRECLGSLSLRRGCRNTVEGNYFLGNGRTGLFLDSTGRTWILGTGGVRFYGHGMLILNNYFEGLTGTRWDATIAIPNGNIEMGQNTPKGKHFRIYDASIVSNTFVNNSSNLEVGYDGDGFQGNWWHLPPINLQIQDNIIVGGKDTLIKIFTDPVSSSWINNIAWATSGAVVSRAPIQGIQVRDPKLVNEGEVWHVPGQPYRTCPLTRKDVGPDAE
jgi:poly(beta-D-mannuronate) lyase